MVTIAITGGIGAGKSVVSRILRAMGLDVYDCDSEAKKLMDRSNAIKRRIADEIHCDAIKSDGEIDRALLASIVFNDTMKLQILNDIVHGCVREDIAGRVSVSPGKLFFIETAILYQSGLDRMADRVWEVTAPDDVRIRRVMRRNGCKAEDVAGRIASQQFIPEAPHPATDIIVNDDVTPVLPQIVSLLETLA